MRRDRRFRVWVEDEIPVVISQSGRCFKEVIYLFGEFPNRLEVLFTDSELKALEHYVGEDMVPGKKLCFKEIKNPNESRIHLPIDVYGIISKFDGNPLGFNLGEITGFMEIEEEMYQSHGLFLSEAQA